MMRLTIRLAVALLLASGLFAGQGLAQTRQQTLLVVLESGTNSLDIHGVGANPASYGVAWNVYDRLVSYGVKTLPDGSLSYDYSKIVPELAESFDVAADGMSVTFRLRPDATFHDGSPVTARDVKWSLDRAVSVGGFPSFQLKAGSLEKPEQFVVVDDRTLRVDFLRKDKLSLPDLGTPVAVIINSELAKKHATPEDPWAMEWLKSNDAGGGAFRVDSWKPGQEIVFSRFDAWKSGPLPKLQKVIVRDVPGAGSRRALLERGDVDVSFDLPPKDFGELAKSGKVKVVGVPIENSLWYLGFGVKQKPFDNPLVRQAVAYALPYGKIMEAVFYGRAIPMFGTGANPPKDAAWPQPSPYGTDLDKARELLRQAGVGPLSTTLSINQGVATITEPMAILIQESLEKIGITVSIQKIPGANWRAAILKKDMPLLIDTFAGWLNYPDYYFFWGYHGQNAVFNPMGYQNPDMDKLIDAARFETDKAKYDELVKGFIAKAWTDVPRAPIAQYFLDAAMQKSVDGYTYWFHRHIDFRSMSKH